MMKSVYILLMFTVILLSLLVIGAGCVQQEQTKREVITAKLISLTGGDLVSSANYYEGSLVFQDTMNMSQYNLFLCTTDWSVVKLMSCYELNLTEVAQNIESHRMSSELSGCYVGTIQKVNC